MGPSARSDNFEDNGDSVSVVESVQGIIQVIGGLTQEINGGSYDWE